jgi:hypothetical protein
MLSACQSFVEYELSKKGHEEKSPLEHKEPRKEAL